MPLMVSGGEKRDTHQRTDGTGDKGEFWRVEVTSTLLRQPYECLRKVGQAAAISFGESDRAEKMSVLQGTFTGCFRGVSDQQEIW